MYDPLVVDTFAQVYRDIAPEPVPFGNTKRALQEITSSTSQTASHGFTSRPLESSNSVDEVLTLFSSAQALAGNATISETCDVIAKHLHDLIPSALCVFYMYDPNADDLLAQHATGEGGTAVKGLRMELGHRLSGWVAANRRTIVNSDPILDLGDLARGENSTLRSSLSTPLILKDELIGVVTLYSRDLEAFSEEKKRGLEVLAPHIAHSLRRARDFDAATKRRTLMTPTNREELAFRTGRR
jgi:GAF domain-containing protein